MPKFLNLTKINFGLKLWIKFKDFLERVIFNFSHFLLDIDQIKLINLVKYSEFKSFRQRYTSHSHEQVDRRVAGEHLASAAKLLQHIYGTSNDTQRESTIF